MFIVEMLTKTGPVCESYATYEEAKRRVDGMPAESLVGLPLIFKELADGSQRLVREDGKPLQWHRLPEDAPPAPDEPVPLSDPLPDSPGIRHLPPPEEFPWEDEDLPLAEG